MAKIYEKSYLNTKKALLINFTGDSYHWGCYGTSMEIYQSLLEQNYYVEIIPVFKTHSASPTVEKIEDFNSQNFFKDFCQSNQDLVQSMYQSDIIIVNGEGTLHRISKRISKFTIFYANKQKILCERSSSN